MKKCISILMIICMVFSFDACSNKDKESKDIKSTISTEDVKKKSGNAAVSDIDISDIDDEILKKYIENGTIKKHIDYKDDMDKLDEITEEIESTDYKKLNDIEKTTYYNKMESNSYVHGEFAIVFADTSDCYDAYLHETENFTIIKFIYDNGDIRNWVLFYIEEKNSEISYVYEDKSKNKYDEYKYENIDKESKEFVIIFDEYTFFYIMRNNNLNYGIEIDNTETSVEAFLLYDYSGNLICATSYNDKTETAKCYDGELNSISEEEFLSLYHSLIE